MSVKFYLSVALFAVAFQGTVEAGVIIQERWEAASVFDSPKYYGQTFTAEDSMLSSIAIGVRVMNPQLSAPDTSVTMSLFTGAGVDGSLLATRSLQPALAGPYGTELWLDFGFDGTVLTAGNVYSFSVTAPSVYWGIEYYGALIPSTGEPWPDKVGHDYTGGYMFNDLAHVPSQDLRFRVVPIPEPASIVLGVAGFLTLALMRKIFRCSGGPGTI